MRRCALLSIAVALAAAAAVPDVSLADGPYEPNETAAMALAPVTSPRIDAAFETPQDEDWYLLHPQGVRQIGVLATLPTPCGKASGRISVDLLDGEGSALPVDSVRLGYDPFAAGVIRTTAATTFTSLLGHRYLIHVTQYGCTGAAYSLELAPNGALGTRLARTKACDEASAARDRASYKLKRLKALRSRARGARRKALGVKVQLQAQQVTVARANARTVCARPALTGYPWE